MLFVNPRSGSGSPDAEELAEAALARVEARVLAPEDDVAALARLRALWLVARSPQPLRVTVDGEPLAARVVLVANNHYELDLAVEPGALRVLLPPEL